MREQGILYRFLPTEQAPPIEVWERLEKVLDELERAPFTKLSQLEVIPPPLAWNNIAEMMDMVDERPIVDTYRPSFGETVSKIKQVPPRSAWANIEKSLDSNATEKKHGNAPRIIRMVAVGLAIAACTTGIVFMGIGYLKSLQVTDKNQAVAVGKVPDAVLPAHNSKPQLKGIITTSNGLAILQQKINDNPIVKSNDINSIAQVGSLQESDERNLDLANRKWTAGVNDINTTNNKVANNTNKLKDLNGNIIDRISDYTTGGGGFIAAIGPNGNSVRVSTKLANMIEFFQEDSTHISTEEYLDKVMRETNVWRKKLLDWKSKVNEADTNPSNMNFLDPIDLLRFLKENK